MATQDYPKDEDLFKKVPDAKAFSSWQASFDLRGFRNPTFGKVRLSNLGASGYFQSFQANHMPAGVRVLKTD